jgi:hypothetical protein
MKEKDLIKIVGKYCSKINYNNKHYMCHLLNGKTATIASTSSDTNYFRQVYRDFRRNGVFIKEIKY